VRHREVGNRKVEDPVSVGGEAGGSGVPYGGDGGAVSAAGGKPGGCEQGRQGRQDRRRG